MKKRLFLLSTGLLFTLTFLFAQNVPVEVVSAFKKGNTQELNQYLGEDVELIIQHDSRFNNKQNALSGLSSFFENKTISDFEINHLSNRDESSFMIGTLATNKGRYRVNCFFRKPQNTYIIHQIRIDKINE